MKKVNVFEAKAHLSEYLDAVEGGEVVVICRRNQPVAELRAIGSVRTSPRPIGGAKGFTVPDAFFDSLPDEIIDGFYSTAAKRPSTVAESVDAVKRTRVPAKRSR